MFSADQAFSVLGNETRMSILQELGNVSEGLSFSELRDRVGISDSGQFNYHLNKLDGHYITKVDDHYELSRVGNRVVQAVLSGAVTESPVMDLTDIEEYCYHCGTKLKIDYRDQRVGVFCPGCDANHVGESTVVEERLGSELASEFGLIGFNPLPPAGVEGRSADDVYWASGVWIYLESIYHSARLCPRCSAHLEITPDVCDTHEVTENVCDTCGNRQAIHMFVECSTCNYELNGLPLHLLATKPFFDFLTSRDQDPITPDSPIDFWGRFHPYEEEIVSVDPLEARLKYTMDTDALILTVNEKLQVTDSEERHLAE